MVRAVLAAAILAGASAMAHAQSASAPLVVTATVVSTCNVNVPQSASASVFATFPITVTCARRGTSPRVLRPIVPPRSDVQDAVLIINF